MVMLRSDDPNDMSDDSKPHAEHRRAEVFLAGRAGEKPAYPFSSEELRAAAEEALDDEAWAYLAGGAGAERTAAANREAFDRWAIRPRVLRGVESTDLSTSVGDRSLSVPTFLAPIGQQSVAHDGAELATARAAADVGVPMCVSSVASEPLEDVADALGGTEKWFQLYWSSDREVAGSFVDRAGEAGYDAVVLTVDTPVPGWRERELREAFVPFFEGHGVANYLSDPVFRERLDEPPEAGEAAEAAAIQRLVRTFGDPSLTWSDLAWLRDRTDLPVFVKGILHPEDARLAADHADGVIVSNHGGRQIDGAIAALEALPAVVDAVPESVPVCFDSGIRGGADATVALALGADAVGLGRPYVYGLAAGGQAGLEHVLKDLLADLDVTLQLSGVGSVAALSRDLLVDRRAL
jgi:isopentenyl-diphosphate delta-isomerase